MSGDWLRVSTGVEGVSVSVVVELLNLAKPQGEAAAGRDSKAAPASASAEAADRADSFGLRFGLAFKLILFLQGG
ncbi:MAG: hypothetical protein OHK0037_09740 [Elainellaceae cyanobacterium]